MIYLLFIYVRYVHWTDCPFMSIYHLMSIYHVHISPNVHLSRPYISIYYQSIYDIDGHIKVVDGYDIDGHKSRR